MKSQILLGVSTLIALMSSAEGNLYGTLGAPYRDNYGGYPDTILSQAISNKVLKKYQQKLALGANGYGLAKPWDTYKCGSCGKLAALKSGYGLGDACSCGCSGSLSPQWPYSQQPGDFIQALPPLPASLPISFDPTSKFNCNPLSLPGPINAPLPNFPISFSGPSSLSSLPCNGQRSVDFLSPDPYGAPLNGPFQVSSQQVPY